MQSSTLRVPQQVHHISPSLREADFLMGPRKTSVMSAVAKGLEWTSSLFTTRGIESAIHSQDQRITYKCTRLCSLSFLPVEFRTEASQFCNQYLNKDYIKRALKLASADNSEIPKKNVVYAETLIDYIRRSSFDAVSRCTSQFTFWISFKDSALGALLYSPYSPVLTDFLQRKHNFGSSPCGIFYGSPRFENDTFLGPLIRELTEKIVTLTVNGTILADALKSIHVSFGGLDMLCLCKQYPDIWQFFETRHWRNMVALSEHIQSLHPGIDEGELSSFVTSFYKSKYPIEEFTDYRQRLKAKIASRRATSNSRQSVNPEFGTKSLPSESNNTPLPTHDFEPVIKEHLTSVNPFGLTPQQISKYARNLAKLANLLGMKDCTPIQELIKQEYHPESVSRELRSQLRPRSSPAQRTEGQLPYETVDSSSVQNSVPTPYISHYCDENGRDLITEWLKEHPKEIAALVQEKLDLIRQGARSKSVTSIRHDKSFGLQECRILCHNAALRVYFLPKQRETGEIKVLLIGDKRDQVTDIDEAMKRAAYILNAG
jgi:hypothetical protein